MVVDNKLCVYTSSSINNLSMHIHNIQFILVYADDESISYNIQYRILRGIQVHY